MVSSSSFKYMTLQVLDVFNHFENGMTPPTRINYSDTYQIDSISSNTMREDFIGAEHIKDNTFAIIKIKPVRESQNEKIQRNIKQSYKPFDSSNKFKHCVYQLGTVQIPSFREENTSSHRNILHKVCNWNQPGVTRLRTAMSAQQLENAWLEYIKQK